jgi:uncharacterized membrane protein YccC
LIPHSGEGALLLTLALAVAPIAFVAAINPSLSAATMTTIIVLLYPNHGDPFDSAIARVFEVVVGALTGLFVSFLVLPSRAHGQVRAQAAQVLELMASTFNELLSGLTQGRDSETVRRLRDGIGTALTGLNSTGAEAERDRAAHLSNGSDTGPLLRTVARLRHDQVMIGRASVEPLPADLQRRLAVPLARVSDTIVEYLRKIATALRTGERSPPIKPVRVALDAYIAEVTKLRSSDLMRGMLGDVAERFFVLDYSLEQMNHNLNDLRRCVTDWTEVGHCRDRGILHRVTIE